MALIRCSTSSGGGGSLTLDYDYVRNLVESKGHTYDIVGYQSRATVNNGGVYVDTETNVAYMYVDLTFTKTETPSTWNGVAIFSPTTFINDMPTPSPSSAGSSAFNKVLIEHEKTLGATTQVTMVPYQSQGYIVAKNKYTSGQNYKLYGFWTIGTN